jgi:Family of unknown function (DUF5343)
MIDEKKTPAAVYVPWGTFKNAIEGLAQAIPNRIDKTVYPGLNPAVVSQLLAAFKFLGLTDENGKPTVALQALALKDEEARKQKLSMLLRQKYSDLFDLDLVKTTPAELAEKMEKSYSVTGDTREKAIRFFLAGVTYLGVPVSPLLKKTTSANNGPRKKRANGSSKRQEEDLVSIQRPPVVPQQPTATWEEQLLGKFPSFDPTWPDDLKTKWFEGFGRLMGAKGAKP